MWIHIMLFILLPGLALSWKIGWLKMEGLNHEKGKKLFLIVALGGNLLGLLLTLENGGGTKTNLLLKEEDYAYEQKIQVTVEDGERGAIYLQIPEKESTEEAPDDKPENRSEQERWQQELRETVREYNEEKTDSEYYYLPDEWNGKKLEWKYPVDHTGNMLAALSLFAAVLVLIKVSREEEEKRIQRYEELLLEYPGLVMKFTLLIQAGMPVRKVFQKIALDYRRKRKVQKRIAYEEVLVTCYEMESGISEAEAYRRFGDRCGQMKYKTFATLLIQNLQKGSRRLADTLEAESLEAWDERKRKARIQGEIASTKLLLPMIMMLMVVMALIMVPAFLSFYG